MEKTILFLESIPTSLILGVHHGIFFVVRLTSVLVILLLLLLVLLLLVLLLLLGLLLLHLDLFFFHK